MNITNAPFLAAACWLLLCASGTLLLQSVGYFLGLQALLTSLAVSAVMSFYTVYWHFFGRNRKAMATLAGVTLLFCAIGVLSAGLWDMTSDGLGYQQPGAGAILAGWNPLQKTDMLWQNIYPTATWQLGATLAALLGSIESAKMYTTLWIFIAYPILLEGVKHHLGRSLHILQHAVVALIVFCPIVFSQALTHYVDAALYLSGVTFLGSTLLLGSNPRLDRLALWIMAGCIVFMVNAKLSGIYHAATLCSCVVVILFIQRRKIPLKESAFLFISGLVAVVVVGYHPYATNILHYGSLLPMYSGGSFSAGQRPANMTDMNNFQTFFYSIFSATGGAPGEVAVLKFPWKISPREWFFAGVPDNRSGGFGVWFGLALLSISALLTLQFKKLNLLHNRLLIIAVLLVLSSLAFPQNWWARYVPFAYAAITFLLLAIPYPQSRGCRIIFALCVAILSINSVVSAISAVQYQHMTQRDFTKIATELAYKNNGRVYLVPPGDDYLIYNHAHITLTRRLSYFGITTDVRVNAACPNKAATLSEFLICY